jgi:hypothetical protein
VFLAALSSVVLAASFAFPSASTAPTRRPRQATVVECTLSAQGADVVVVGKHANVEFTANTEGGVFDKKVADMSPNISVKEGSVDGKTLVLQVKGEETSKKVGDAKFTVDYTCPDKKTKKSITWLMTVLPKGQARLGLQIVAQPSEPGSVTIGGDVDIFKLIAYPSYLTEQAFSTGWEPPLHLSPPIR